jgi:prepilin-type N-terminal cleavage/methylation domain-containing protein
MMNNRGFSLAELLVSLAVIGLVLGGIFALQQKGQETYLIGSNRVEAQQNARVALDLITRELRELCAIDTGMLPTSTVIRFTIVDPNLSPTTPGYESVDCSMLANVVTITYAWSGGTLTRQLGAAAAEPVVGGVDSLALSYFDGNNGSIGTVTSSTVGTIRSVDVELTTKSEGSVVGPSSGDVRSRLKSRVRLRSL